MRDRSLGGVFYSSKMGPNLLSTPSMVINRHFGWERFGPNFCPRIV